MNVYVITNNTRGRFWLTPSDIDKLMERGFTMLPRYGGDEPYWRDEAGYGGREGMDPSVMEIPRFQGRLAIDIPVDDEEKARATARWKFYNALGRKSGPIADCDCCGASERFDTEDYYSDDD